MKENFIFDLETQDPDDLFTLALLATHPSTNLLGVTIYPGGEDQVGVVRHILNRLGQGHVPIGVGTKANPSKSYVSGFHYAWLGKVAPAKADGSAVEVMLKALEEDAETHLVTGAALSNVVAACDAHQARESSESFTFVVWTGQGGFAGDNIVLPEHVLPKFKGLLTCPTFNLNGDVKASLRLLAEDSPLIFSRYLVSKNVCHGVIWDPAFQESLPSGAYPGLDLIKEGMSHYFQKHPQGKALHDVIAACLAINPDAADWESVVPYRAQGAWGCKPFMHKERDTSDMDSPLPVRITTYLDVDAFRETLIGAYNAE